MLGTGPFLESSYIPSPSRLCHSVKSAWLNVSPMKWVACFFWMLRCSWDAQAGTATFSQQLSPYLSTRQTKIWGYYVKYSLLFLYFLLKLMDYFQENENIYIPDVEQMLTCPKHSFPLPVASFSTEQLSSTYVLQLLKSFVRQDPN